jgi:hypothetical protein
MIRRINNFSPRTRTSVAEAQKQKEGFRWWEYYAVRYAMGVGLGTALVCLLWHHYHAFFEPTIHIPTPFNSPIAAILWAAIGLTYCYIASVPMLTIHTARVLLGGALWSRGKRITLILLLIVPLPVIYFCSQWIGCGELTQKAALVLLWLVISFQGFLIFTVLLEPKATECLYDKLDDKRPRFPGFVESYRHMREHGNSVLIVIGELLLTLCLWELHPVAAATTTDSKVLFYFGLVLFFWLAPSSLVWVVGTRLERHLTDRK